MSPAHAAGAASVVTQLRAFLKEPAGHRGQFGGGRASLEAGQHVFKFAQGKFPHGLAQDMPSHEREELRRAAVAFIREVCFREGASHYRMLCVPADAKRDAIKENYHLLMALIHPDRAEGAREAWPAEWAQRANRAYAVLADEASRTVYDKALNAFATAPPGPHPAPRSRSPASKTQSVKTRVAGAMLVLGAVVSTLLLLDAWVGGFSDAQFPFNGAARGRDIGTRADRPRFLGANVMPARDGSYEASPPIEAHGSKLLAPPWRDFTPEPAIVARPSAPAPAPQPALPVAVREVETPMPTGNAAIAVAEVAAPATLAQAPLPPAVREASLTSAEIEIVVARLIGYYEAGDTDNLIALLDPREAGYAQTLRMRQAYGDFFRATRERRLRVKRLDWQNASASAHAQGQATVQAEYVDAPGGLERDIDVEMQIVLRNGQARITRLTLFPNVP